ncbi:hypothetical protein [Actinokineospora cianjurensis]|uniref:hypothetical protein n=1 Tax=Actinokineospora cianjurensis TaxID=585224 RepID=UPI003CCC8083
MSFPPVAATVTGSPGAISAALSTGVNANASGTGAGVDVVLVALAVEPATLGSPT